MVTFSVELNVVVPVTPRDDDKVVAEVTPNVPPTVALPLTPSDPVIEADAVVGLNTKILVAPEFLMARVPPVIVSVDVVANVFDVDIGELNVEVELTVNVSAESLPKVIFAFAIKAPVKVVVPVTPRD